MDSALPRFPLIFFGLEPGLERAEDVSPLVRRTLSRGRELYYPMIGLEYRRVGYASGTDAFDDRSTAFGVSSLAFSHAVTDVAQVFRYIWLKAGGATRAVACPWQDGTWWCCHGRCPGLEVVASRRRALLSVSDKRDLAGFARGLGRARHRDAVDRRHARAPGGGGRAGDQGLGGHRLSRDPRTAG